jgi:FKBP-type peptidyl-prolyl cis-trans isomerase 2
VTITTGDTVEIEYTGRTDDGTVFDTSRESVASDAGLTRSQSDREYTSLTVEIGAGRVLEGLEDALVGLEQETTATVAIPPEKGYGEWSEDKLQEHGVEELTRALGGQTPEEGTYLKTEDGARAEVVHVDDEVARLDFNEPLAGETLEFDVEVLAVD